MHMEMSRPELIHPYVPITADLFYLKEHNTQHSGHMGQFFSK